MDLSTLDTSKFLYDPKNDSDLRKLERHKEMQVKIKGMHRKKVLQYTILMYDANNDEVRTEWPFYPQRKTEVARMVGLFSGKKIPEHVEDLLIGKIPEFNAMAVRYLTLFNNPDLIMLAAYYEIYIYLSKQSFSGKADKNLIANLDTLNHAIKKLTENIFHGVEETDLRKELYKTMEEQSLGIRPEEMAEKLHRGEDPLEGFSPYGEDYGDPVLKIKFIGDK